MIRYFCPKCGADDCGLEREAIIRWDSHEQDFVIADMQGWLCTSCGATFRSDQVTKHDSDGETPAPVTDAATADSPDDWTAQDSKAAVPEGWDVFANNERGDEIERCDCTGEDETGEPLFDGDDSAVAHVEARAAQGSPLHVKALAIHRRTHPLPARVAARA